VRGNDAAFLLLDLCDYGQTPPSVWPDT